MLLSWAGHLDKPDDFTLGGWGLVISGEEEAGAGSSCFIIQVPAPHANLKQARDLLQLTGQRRLFSDTCIHIPLSQHPGFGLASGRPRPCLET